MNFYQKKKVRDFFKKSWGFFVGSGAFLLIASIIAIVGFSITGWSIVKWIQSPYAVTTAVFVVLGALIIAFIYVLWKRHNILK